MRSPRCLIVLFFVILVSYFPFTSVQSSCTSLFFTCTIRLLFSQLHLISPWMSREMIELKSLPFMYSSNIDESMPFLTFCLLRWLRRKCNPILGLTMALEHFFPYLRFCKQTTVPKSQDSITQASLCLLTYLCDTVITSETEPVVEKGRRWRRLHWSCFIGFTILGHLLPNLVIITQIL